MRMLPLFLLAGLVAAPVHAQSATQQFFVGPSFAPSSIQKDKFDAVFQVKVDMAGVPVLRHQSPDARYDAAVCNIGKIRGGARVNIGADRWSLLDPGMCTMFANLSQLELTPMETGDWTAEVYLRAHR